MLVYIICNICYIYIYINIVTDFIVAHASHASRVIILLYTCDGSMDAAIRYPTHCFLSPKLYYAANIVQQCISHAYVLARVCVYTVTLYYSDRVHCCLGRF